MASVVGLLEEREPAAWERVEGLREEADRVLAALADAETDWQEWVIAWQRVGEVLSVPRIREDSSVPVEEPSALEREPEPLADAPAVVSVPAAARAGSIIPRRPAAPGRLGGVETRAKQRTLSPWTTSTFSPCWPTIGAAGMG
ncbi:hypothetical protein ACFY8F_35395 [Streptomyces tanashiensis]|uniref:hypothetical protein n=1 Tax=Streptomyces tanashiensis TaxID=67367 RepID=UPI0036993EB3